MKAESPTALRTDQYQDSSRAPRGDPSKGPEKLTWPEGWAIGEPDLILTTPEFTVPAEGRVPYRYVTVPANLTEDRWVQAAQVVSTENEVVHHVLVFLKESRASRRRKDRPGGTPMAQVEFLHICDHAFTAKGDKPCIIGIFTQLHGSQFPMIVPRMAIALQVLGQRFETVPHQQLQLQITSRNTKARKFSH